MTTAISTEELRRFKALCQQKNFGQALPLARRFHPLLAQNVHLARRWGWVIYERLKDLAEQARAKQAPASRQANSLPEHLSRKIREALVEYARLPNLHTPDLLHAMILVMVCRIGVRWSGVLGFLYHVRAFDTLRPEDRLPKTYGDRTYPSIEQLLTQTVAAALAKLPFRDQRPEVLDWACVQVQQRLDRFPDEPWIPYHLACYLIKKQRGPEARPLLAPVLLQHRHKSWIWERVARANHDRPEHRLTALTQALRLAERELPTVRFRLHLELADLLATRQRHDEAAAQLQAARRLEEQLGRNVRDDRNPLWQRYRHMLQQPWFRQRAEQTNLPRTPTLTIEPEAILYEHLPTTESFGVIIGHNSEKGLTIIRLSPSKIVRVKHRKFPDASRLEPGTVVWLRLVAEQVVALEPRPDHPLPDLVRWFRGRLLQPDGRAFAFVITGDEQRIFIPPRLNRKLNLEADATVEVLAERTIDPTKNTHSWSALKVKPVADQ